ncbi:hypothetical protein [Pseudolactococcus hodotermopsidis]|nr:hypothetical protein [Lactococcus hodotermopsidis]
MTEKKIQIFSRILASLMIVISLSMIAHGNYKGMNLLWFVALYAVAFRKINAFLARSRLTLFLVLVAVGLQVLMMVLGKL